MDNAYEPQVFRLPFPADFDDATYESMASRASALMGAAEKIFQLASGSGQKVELSEDDRVVGREVFSGTQPLSTVRKTAEAIHLTALLNAYDITVVQSAQQIRNFCTNILIDKAATAAKDSDRLNAVKMLGQIKDVALFEERSTVLVQNMTTDQIKSALMDKVALMRSKAAAADTVEVHHAEETSRI